MEREMDIFSGERNQPGMEVVNVAPNGLGFGEGKVSLENRRDEITPEIMNKIETVVQSSEILVPVDVDESGQRLDDDGCGDGRVWKRVFKGAVEKFRSLNRSKVFGGGVTMAASTLIGLGKQAGRTLQETFSDGISILRDKQIGFGAHTDSHSEHDETNCGCGAIDKAKIILGNAVKFKDQIRASIGALGVDQTGLDAVEENFENYATSGLGEYAGQNVVNEISDNGKIVKELDDDHKEVIIILNMVEGFTVDQEKIREVTGGRAQAFAVDVWRVKEIADRLYADESDEVRHQAFLSELVYTLATAGTLTKGDLPVFVVNKQPELVAA